MCVLCVLSCGGCGGLLTTDQVTGPDAVPFQQCALQNLAAFQKVGLSVGTMLAISSRCKEEPACVQEYVAKYAPPSPPHRSGSTSAGASATSGAAPDNTAAAEVTKATAMETTAGATATETVGTPLPAVDPPAMEDVGGLSSRQKLTVAIAVPAVFAAAAAWVCLFVVIRERRRKILAAQHVASLDEAARDGVNRLDFDDITCVLRTPGGCAWRGSGRGRGGRGQGRGLKKGRLRDVVGGADTADTTAAAAATAAADDESDRSDSGDGGRVLLSHVSGHASRGQILALLGPSGAGKSTLLKIIAGRSPSSADAGLRLTSGEVTLDGIRQTPRELSRAVAMVPQEDNLLPFLTVLETVMYSAELRLPWFTPREEKRAKALDVLEELGLSGVANNRVGGGGGFAAMNGGGGGGGGGGFGGGREGLLAGGIFSGGGGGGGVDTGGRSGRGGGGSGGGGGGVSGGERRRTVVAMELVTSPGIIVLDEPTSGLDAAAAASMIFTMRSLASGGAGRVVVFSVHQPSPRAFRALDHVLLLGTGGRTLWTGAPEAAEMHFTAAGLPCPVSDVRGGGSGGDGDGYRVDISEWMLEVASCSDKRATLLAAAAAADGRAAADNNSTNNTFCEVDVVVSYHADGDEAAAATAASTAATAATAARERRRLQRRRWRSTLTEMRVLLRRSAVTIARDPSLLVAHFAIAALTGLLLGCLYLNSPRTLAGFQNRAGGMFFSLVFFASASISASDRVAAESHVRAREIRSGYYSPVSYVFATVVTDVAALRALPVLLYSVVLYSMMGLRQSAGAFFIFLGLLELFVACASLLCSFISLSAPSPAVAHLVATFTLLLSAMFGGTAQAELGRPMDLKGV